MGGDWHDEHNVQSAAAFAGHADRFLMWRASAPLATLDDDAVREILLDWCPRKLSMPAETRLFGLHLLEMFDADVVEPHIRPLLDTAGHSAIWLCEHGFADAGTVGGFITPAVLLDILSELVDHPNLLCEQFLVDGIPVPGLAGGGYRCSAGADAELASCVRKNRLEDFMGSRRATRAATAAFVLGLSLAGPPALGVAAADSDQPDTVGTSAEPGTATPRSGGAAARGSGPVTAATPRTARGGNARASAQTSIPAAAASALRSAPAVVTRTSSAGVPRAEVPTVPAVVSAAAVEQLTTSGTTPISTAATRAASAQALDVAADPVQQLLNSIGRWLSDQPVSPLTDFLSGSLWLVRRTLTTLSTALGGWGPSACNCATAAPSAQVLTVTSAVDGAAGSLREVLSTAASGDVIRFAPTLRRSTLTLTQGELDIDISVRIEGSGQTLDAAGLSRIMRLDEAGTSISLSGLTFANGFAPGDPTSATMGGAILADGVTLQICGSTFTGNSAVSAGPAASESAFAQFGVGGAIAALGSTVSISDSTFASNTAVGADNDTEQQASAGLGGAIFAEGSEIALLRSRFTGNSVIGGSGVTPIQPFPSSDGGWAAGGAIYAAGAAFSAVEVIFGGNSATGGDGLDGSESNPYNNTVGTGGNASGGALWVQGLGYHSDDPGAAVTLQLQQVRFSANTATGGSSGAQGSATLGGQQGGRAVGGALGAVEWVAVTAADITVDGNLAQGGDGGVNAADAGSNTGTGGVGQAGGVFLESPASLDATRLSVRCNTARGGQGGNSAPDSGTEAGEGGFAYGGGLFLNNATGGLHQPTVIPLNVRDSEIVGNSAVGGAPGEGTVPADGVGAGALAQGGGLNMQSLFATQLVGVRFIGNSAIASQGKLAAGGALADPYGAPPAGVEAALLVLNSLFRDNAAVGGDDAANEVYRESGGGAFLHNGSGTVISGSRFADNTVIAGNDTGSGHLGSATGGAIQSLGQNPTLTILNTTFVGNTVLGGRRLVAGASIVEAASGEARGGALSSENGTVTIIGGTFASNQAIVRTTDQRLASGGAIDMPLPSSGYLSYLNTTAVRFSSNAAISLTGAADGGAVAFDGTAFTDNGSTFSGNTARSGRQSGSAYGGALFLQTTTQLNGSVVVRNRAQAATGYGGGIALPLGPDVLTQVQTTVGRNRASTAGDDLWWPATVAQQEMNLVGADRIS